MVASLWKRGRVNLPSKASYRENEDQSGKGRKEGVVELEAFSCFWTHRRERGVLGGGRNKMG